MKTTGFEKKGRSIALMIGLDEDQTVLGKDSSFWKLIEDRRSQDVVSREELESVLDAD